MSLQEGNDENSTMTFEVEYKLAEYSSISKKDFESQFKLAFERGVLESLLRSKLEESGNPAYLLFIDKLSVTSLSIETDESQVIDDGSGGGSDGNIIDIDDIDDNKDDSKKNSAFSLRPSAGENSSYLLVITVLMLIMTSCF